MIDTKETARQVSGRNDKIKTLLNRIFKGSPESNNPKENINEADQEINRMLSEIDTNLNKMCAEVRNVSSIEELREKCRRLSTPETRPYTHFFRKRYADHPMVIKSNNILEINSMKVKEVYDKMAKCERQVKVDKSIKEKVGQTYLELERERIELRKRFDADLLALSKECSHTIEEDGKVVSMHIGHYCVLCLGD